jgi:hypothetical protein
MERTQLVYSYFSGVYIASKLYAIFSEMLFSFKILVFIFKMV